MMLFMGLNGFGQSSEYRIINEPLVEVLPKIASEFGVSIHYKMNWIDGVMVSGVFNDQSIGSILHSLVKGTDLSVIQYDSHNLILINQSLPASLIEILENRGGSNHLLIIGSRYSGDNTALVSGQVVDQNTKQVIPGAIVTIGDRGSSKMTDTDGLFEIESGLGRFKIFTQAPGFDNSEISIEIVNDGQLSIEMFEQYIELNEIIVTDRNEASNFQSLITGVEKMDIQTIKSMPSFMGEVDIIKSLTSLPGVSTVGEGATGFNVRGGTVGQNLILQDDAIIFNSSHLFGFFSSFNPDVVSEVVLYKTGGPANYGGRISSTLDVKTKNGSQNEFSTNGSVGLITSKVTVDGPIIKDKVDFVLGARLSTVNWLLGKVKDPLVKRSKADFYDVNAKLGIDISDNGRLSISGYSSFDNFALASDTIYAWGTTNLSAKYTQRFGTRMVGEFSLGSGKYVSSVEDQNGLNSFKLDAGIDHSFAKLDFSNFYVKHRVDYGASFINYRFAPGELMPGANSVNIEDQKVDNETSGQLGLYVSDEFNINTKLGLTVGLRYSLFTNYGEANVFTYQDGLPKNSKNVDNEINFGRRESVKAYSGFEPRLSLRYLTSSSSSIKANFSVTRQYVHLISNTSASTPTDYWQSSNYHVPDQIGYQYSIGAFQSVNDGDVELSFEPFYKKIKNALDYKEGSSVLLNQNLEQDLLIGDGLSYGSEFLIRKKEGRLTGWLGYTFSRSLLRFESEFQEETISLGKFYPSNYDKPHEFGLNILYKLSRGIKFSGAFTYATGRPVTAPVSKYSVRPAVSILNYSERNQFRIPDYHRLDVALIFDNKQRRDKKVKSEWVVSFYNLYARKNPYSVYFNQAGFAYRLAVLGAVFPSVSYNFKF